MKVIGTLLRAEKVRERNRFDYNLPALPVISVGRAKARRIQR